MEGFQKVSGFKERAYLKLLQPPDADPEHLILDDVGTTAGS